MKSLTLLRTQLVSIGLLIGACSVIYAESKPESGLAAKAEAIQVLHFETEHPITNARILSIRGSKTNITTLPPFFDDYGKSVKIGIVFHRLGSFAKHSPSNHTILDSKIMVSVSGPNFSSEISTDFYFSQDARENGKERIAPKKLPLKKSTWTEVYSYSERSPPSELKIELIAHTSTSKGNEASLRP